MNFAAILTFLFSFFFDASIFSAIGEAPTAPSEEAQFNNVLIPISSHKPTIRPKMTITGRPGVSAGLDSTYGTGFCLDPECRFVGTVYHVANSIKVRKIGKVRVFDRYLATGPRDKHAVLKMVGGGRFTAFAPGRDLAIYQLTKPLPGHHGIPISLQQPQPGDRVEIYGYPKDSLRLSRPLIHAPARFLASTTSGLLSFEYDSPHKDGSLIMKGGASGGIVVDTNTQRVVGILSGATDTIAFAVPAETLSDFVRQVLPTLADKLFPLESESSIMAVSADFYPPFKPVPESALLRRPEEADEVVALRSKAQSLSRDIANFIAVQTYAWGRDREDSRFAAQYEVRVVDGSQTFREYPDGKKELESLPLPFFLQDFVLGSNEWSTLPELVGKNLHLKLRLVGEGSVDRQSVKVFQFYAAGEDRVCPFSPYDIFPFFRVTKLVQPACYGEVWTDADLNIVRISENFDLSERRKEYRAWRDLRTVVAYKRLVMPDGSEPLLPSSIRTEGFDGKHLYWCRGQFLHYQMFGVKSRVLPAVSASDDSLVQSPEPTYPD